MMEAQTQLSPDTAAAAPGSNAYQHPPRLFDIKRIAHEMSVPTQSDCVCHWPM